MPETKSRGTKQRGNADRTRKPARVLIVDDHPFIRKGIRAAIDNQADMVVCGEAAAPRQALAQIEETRPDIAIVDISLPETSGYELIRDIKLRHPALPILVLSMHDEKLYAERAMRSGASGYVMKDEPPQKLLEGLRAVLKGQLSVSRSLANSMLNAYVNSSCRTKEQTGIQALSTRELQVFEGIGSGMSTQQLGRKYCISPKTIETYRSHIKRKLGLATGNDLIHAAVRWVENESTRKPAE